MPPLSLNDRRVLLALARQAIVETVVRQRVPDLPSFTGTLSEPGSAFVTVHIHGRLRGCLGRTDRTLPLGEVVAQCAISAVLRDPRFASVTAEEVPDLAIEISVLSEFSLVPPDAVDPRKHGLQVVHGQHRGLLLPQVAAERNWSAARFLSEVCGKAGLHSDAWRDPETHIYAFTAEVFSDSGF